MLVKAVHIEAVSVLTTEAFLACLQRFIARCGKPNIVWSNYGTNFTGAARELKELTEFLQERKDNKVIDDFCSSQAVEWRFIPEKTPNFGGFWEAAVKSLKTHLRKVIGETKPTFEELTTILAQIEACLNSPPLNPIPAEGDGVKALTPGHFLVGQPLEAVPDHVDFYQSLSMLCHWHLCQCLMRHFLQRWSNYAGIINGDTQ